MLSWVLATFLAVSVAHVVVVALAMRYGAVERGGVPETANRGDVECPACGAVNGSSYRYCRRCVSTLPGSMPGSRPGDRRAGRRTW